MNHSIQTRARSDRTRPGSNRSRAGRRGAVAVAAVFAAALSAAPAAQAQFQDRTLRLAGTVSKGHPHEIGSLAMAACTSAASGGKLKIRGYFDGALGNDAAAVQQARSGSIDLVLTASSSLIGIVPAIGVFDLPFLFSSEAEADAVLDGKAGQWLSDKIPPSGLVNLAWWENGFRHTTNSKRPINRIEDFDGLKVRVMPSNIFIDTFKNLGANAVPMAFTEVYSALETRTMDGQENPFNNIENMKFYEVQKFMSLTKHAYSPLAVLMSKKTYDGLSPQERKVIDDCAIEGRAAQRKASREQGAASLANLKAKGMQVNEVSAAEMDRIRERSKVIYERNAGTVGKETLEVVQAELERIRRK
ncbi:MAG: TRAP transporter substrate-binding protein [Lautropia sp.]